FVAPVLISSTGKGRRNGNTPGRAPNLLINQQFPLMVCKSPIRPQERTVGRACDPLCRFWEQLLSLHFPGCLGESQSISAWRRRLPPVGEYLGCGESVVAERA